MSNLLSQREPLRITLSSRSSRPRIPNESSLANPVRSENPKKANTQEEINFENYISLPSIPNDIIMAIRSSTVRQCVAYCPLITQQELSSLLPFILKPMLHQVFLSKPSAPIVTTDKRDEIHHDSIKQTCVTNAHTGINLELLESCQRNIVRQLVLLGTSNSDESTLNAEDDIAVMETEHYVKGITDAFCSSLSSKKCLKVNEDKEWAEDLYASGMDRRRKNDWTEEQCKQVIEWFIHQLSSWTGPFVKYMDVDRAVKKTFDICISSLDPASKRTAQNQPSFVGLTTQSVLDYLLSIQVLIPRNIPKVTTSDSFWFTLPLLGQVSKALTAGRKQMMIQLKRSYYKEIKLTNLLTKTFGDKNFKLSGNFLVRDFLSRGIAKTAETPSGEFVRLIQNK